LYFTLSLKQFAQKNALQDCAIQFLADQFGFNREMAVHAVAQFANILKGGQQECELDKAIKWWRMNTPSANF
jgi:hypothetical protein